ncbi:phosphatidate cytidylyltransferase, partial [bacterium]|nr:phosphatidate cytidylyltransferase [bacterium]
VGKTSLRIRFFGILIAVLTPAVLHQFGAAAVMPFLISILISLGFLIMFEEIDVGYRALLSIFFAECLFVLPLSTLILLREAQIWTDSLQAAIGVMYIVGGVWLSDSSAYFVGRAFGKHKMSPNKSPNKTFEGAAGGISVALIWAIAIGYYLIPSLTLVDLIAIGIINGCFAIIGDLVESIIKRSAGVKDSGTFLPGHGGILDRFDSLLFSAAGIYLYFLFRGYIGF